MLHSPIPTAVTEGKGTINLCARVLIGNQYAEAHILEASAETQSARVRVPGRESFTAPFRHITSVSLKYADGTVIEHFGTPRISQPASLAFIGYQNAYSI